jgi:hypothetical protein
MPCSDSKENSAREGAALDCQGAVLRTAWGYPNDALEQFPRLWL